MDHSVSHHSCHVTKSHPPVLFLNPPLRKIPSRGYDHLYTSLNNGSSAVNGCRQNESQTADKNITRIHKTSVDHNVLWNEKLHVNKSIIKAF